MRVVTEKALYKFRQLTQDSWDQKIAAVKKEGQTVATKRIKDGHHFHAAILGPREILGGEDRPVQFRAVTVPLDWKLAKRCEMVETARDFIDAAYALDESYDSSLPSVLAATIEGRGLFEYGIGEFFLFYGRFEQKYKAYSGKDAKDKMVTLISGKQEHMKLYKDREHPNGEYVPLPYAVRNIFAHSRNPNTLDGEGKELQHAIQLLREWVESKMTSN